MKTRKTKAMPGRKGDPWWVIEILAGHAKYVTVGRYRSSGNAAFGAVRRAFNEEPEPEGMTIIVRKLPPPPRYLSSAAYDRYLHQIHERVERTT